MLSNQPVLWRQFTVNQFTRAVYTVEATYACFSNLQ